MEASILPPYNRRYLKDSRFSLVLPDREELNHLLSLERNAKTYSDRVAFDAKITQLNENMYDHFIGLITLDNGWRPRCTFDIRQLLAWIDCRSVCWRPYRRMIRIFRHYLLRTILRIDRWLRFWRRKISFNLCKSEEELLKQLESGPLCETIALSSRTRFAIRQRIRREQQKTEAAAAEAAAAAAAPAHVSDNEFEEINSVSSNESY